MWLKKLLALLFVMVILCSNAFCWFWEDAEKTETRTLDTVDNAEPMVVVDTSKVEEMKES